MSLYCFIHHLFNLNGILFLEGSSAPVRDSARLAVKKYRKRSEDDYFMATSPKGRLATSLRNGATFAKRKEMPLSPYSCF